MPRRKFAKPRKRDLDVLKVQKLLNNIGFESTKHFQEWRHFLAFGKFENKDAVFKLASTKKTTLLTQNEFNWNSAIHETPKNFREYLTVPINYNSGSWNGLFYFIAQRFTSLPLVERDSRDISGISGNLNKITKAFYEMGNLPISENTNFAQSTKAKRQRKITPTQSLLNSSTEWAAQVPKDLSSFLKIIENTKDLRRCVGHGDPSPRHMYPYQNKIGFIDGEHAGLRGVLYYDIAYFYIRLRNDHFAKETANTFLKKYKSILKPKAKNIFWEEFRPVLIQRYIGDLWGAANNPKKLAELEPFGNEILNNKII